MRAAELILKEGEPNGARYPIDKEETLIGRHPGTDVTLLDKGISREHAVILWDAQEFVLEDLQSTNGTLVNGKRVRSTPLQDKDEIRIGGLLLQFCLRD